MTDAKRGRERRRNLRIRTRAWVRAEYEGQMRPIRDLSTSGVFIRLDKPPKQGTEVEVTLHSVKLPESVKLTGLIRRSIPNSGMGLEFIRFKGSGQDNLSELLSDLIVPRIMVASQEEAPRKELNRMFNKEGFAILLAEDGNEALHLASDSQLDLVILDMDLDKPSGIDVLKELRSMKGLESVPIIAISSATNTRVLAEAQKLGVTGTVNKPIRQQRVLNFIKMMLEH